MKLNKVTANKSAKCRWNRLMFATAVLWLYAAISVATCSIWQPKIRILAQTSQWADGGREKDVSVSDTERLILPYTGHDGDIKVHTTVIQWPRHLWKWWQNNVRSWELTVMLKNLALWLWSTGMKDATAMWHCILMRILNCTVVVKWIDNAQIQQHAIQHLYRYML